MNDLPEYFDGLVSVLEMYIEEKADHFTLQTYGGEYTFAPYVQALQEHNNLLLIEVTGNNFLEPPLSPIQEESILFLGWRTYPESYLPNYAQFIDQSLLSPREIALLMAKTLHFIYGVDETYTLEIAPQLEKAKTLIHRLGMAQ